MKPEDSLQITIADWLRVKYPDLLWWHTPNGGSRNKIEAVKLKRLGVTPGVPDIFIPSSNHGFFCELKAGKNKPTQTQTEMMQKLNDLGYYCCVCYSLDEFIKEWENYCG